MKKNKEKLALDYIRHPNNIHINKEIKEYIINFPNSDLYGQSTSFSDFVARYLDIYYQDWDIG